MDPITSDKIMLIKRLRALTKLLGKLGVKRLIRENDSYVYYTQQVKTGQLNHVPLPHANVPDVYYYGWGLKESKDFVEQYLDRKARTTTA